MLGQRLRRWPNIKPTLDQCIVFAVNPIYLGVFTYNHVCMSWTDLCDTPVCAVQNPAVDEVSHGLL